MNYEMIRAFYNKLEDAESRFIFDARIKYLFTSDYYHLVNMTEEVNKLFHPPKIINNIRHFLRQPGNNTIDIIIYGAGEASATCLGKLKTAQLNVIAFCDKSYHKWADSGHLDFPVISPNELTKNADYRSCVIVVSSLLHYKEICDSLIVMGFSAEHIYIMESQYNFTNYCYRASYFYEDFMESEENEIFIDAGCFDGETIKQFIDFCKGRYHKIYGFEPHPLSFQNTKANIEKWGIENIELHQKGVWNSDGEYSFTLEYGSGEQGARIFETGTNIIETTSIDKIVKDELITFIKMDVEGAELEALKGARQTIKRCKPKLAISIYHKAEDIIEIPEYIYSLIPDYKFYIRHHNINSTWDVALDTILYAVYPN